MPLFPSRETLISDPKFIKFYGSLGGNPNFRSLLATVQQEMASDSFDGAGCTGMEARALRDAKMEGVDQTVKMLAEFLDYQPNATGQSDLTDLMIEDEQKESE